MLIQFGNKKNGGKKRRKKKNEDISWHILSNDITVWEPTLGHQFIPQRHNTTHTGENIFSTLIGMTTRPSTLHQLLPRSTDVHFNVYFQNNISPLQGRKYSPNFDTAAIRLSTTYYLWKIWPNLRMGKL